MNSNALIMEMAFTSVRKILYIIFGVVLILSCSRDNLNDYLSTNRGTVALKVNLGSSFTGGTGAVSPWVHNFQESIDLTITSTSSTFTQTFTFNPNDPSTFPTTTLPYDSYIWSVANTGTGIPVASSLYVYGSSATPFSVGTATTVLPLTLDTDFALVTVTTDNIDAVTITQNATVSELTTQDNYYFGYINSLFPNYTIAITSSDGMGATNTIAAPVAKTHYNYILNYPEESSFSVTLELIDNFILEDVNVDMVDLDSDGDGVVDALDQCPGTTFGLAVDQTGCEIASFFIDPINGVTVRCPNANIGDIAFINGKRYTVVETAAEAKALVDDLNENTCACTSQLTSLANLFDQQPVLESIEDWDVSNVTSLQQTFQGSAGFNQDLSNWDVSSVTTMLNLFVSTSFNQDISGWDVSNVVNMAGIFELTPFNQDISNWDVSSATAMEWLFYGSSFNQDISGWNVSNVINMSYMFNANSVFNQDLSAWNLTSVENMTGMFLNASAYNQDLSPWNVITVTNCTDFSTGANSWTQPKPNFTNCTP